MDHEADAEVVNLDLHCAHCGAGVQVTCAEWRQGG